MSISRMLALLLIVTLFITSSQPAAARGTELAEQPKICNTFCLSLHLRSAFDDSLNLYESRAGQS